MQILFGLVSDNEHKTWISEAFRGFLTLFDRGVASLISFVYQILFKIADSTIVPGSVLSALVEKAQVILGVFMVFKLSISVLQYIVNPDAMNDKQNGVGNIIQRIIITLALLTAIVPLHIPDSAVVEGSYNYYLKQHGLLFGTLFSLQHRILRDDVIGNIIMGSEYKTLSANDTEHKYINFSDDDSIKVAGDRLASQMLVVAIHPNDEKICGGDKISEGDKSDWYLWKAFYEGKDVYKADTFTPDNLIDDALETSCTSGKNKWAYAYTPILGFVLCGFVLVALISACVDIAIRTLKLVILRIIAPVPILSYLEPQGQKNTFNTWVKITTKTYLQLFIRLAIIYFIVEIVSLLLINADGIDLPFKDGSFTGVLATVFIIIGLFLFARKAPQFIYEAIGLKYEGPQLFKGLGQLAGVGSSALGAIGSAKSAYEGAAKRHSDAKLPLGLSKALNVGSALLGGMGGFRAGVRATADEKDGHFFASARGAQGRYNTRAASGSNAFGRMGDSLSEMVTGQTRYDKDQMDLEKLKNFQNLHKRIETKAEADGDYKLRSGGAGVAGRTVKEIAKEFEDLKNSGTASASKIKAARENLDKAKIEYYRDVINKDSDFYDKNPDGSYIYAFADQVGVVRDEMETIATKYGIDMGYGAGNGYVKGGTIDPDVYKRSVFTADNMHHSIEHSGAYTAHKANHDYMNSGKK